MRNLATDGHDREVIGYLRVVKNAFGRPDPLFIQNGAGVLRERGIRYFSQRGFHGCEIIFGKVTRIGSRIGNHLELLVKLLRKLERALGAKAASVRVPLQARQVVEQGRGLEGRFALFRRDPDLTRSIGL